jgi:hypothetical protein
MGGGSSRARAVLEAGTWKPNLSAKVLADLQQLGVNDATSSKESAALVWLHALAIGVSPLYVEQNGEAVRAGWPRIPWPGTEQTLRQSAALGAGSGPAQPPHACYRRRCHSS